jgi:hypothetical protein
MDESLLPDIDWVVYVDTETKAEYFYNRFTKETQWDVPDEYLQWKYNAVKSFLKSSDSHWRQGEKDGKIFYFNKETRKSQWTAPEEVIHFSESLIALTQSRFIAFEAQKKPAEEAADESVDMSSSSKKEAEEDAEYYEEETYAESSISSTRESNAFDVAYSDAITDEYRAADEVVDDAELKKTLEEKLSSRDSVMEVTVFGTAERYLRIPGTSPKSVVDMLRTSYVGHANMVQILKQWTAIAQGKNNESNSSSGDLSDVEKTICEHISSLIKQRFDKKKADSIIRTGSEVPKWLTDMISSPIWRKMLMALLDANKGSVLLGYCLRQISSLGYHR